MMQHLIEQFTWKGIKAILKFTLAFCWWRYCYLLNKTELSKTEMTDDIYNLWGLSFAKGYNINNSISLILLSSFTDEKLSLSL